MKSKKCFFAVLFSAFLFMLLLSSCGMTSTVTSLNRVSYRDANGFSSSHDLLSGNLVYDIRVKEGEMITLNIETRTESGSISIDIIDEKEEVLFSEEEMEDGIMQVALSEEGQYLLKVHAKKHKGLYRVQMNTDDGSSF